MVLTVYARMQKNYQMNSEKYLEKVLGLKPSSKAELKWGIISSSVGWYLEMGSSEFREEKW